MSKNITKKIKRIMGGEYPVGFAKKGTDLNEDQKNNAVRNLLNKFKDGKEYTGLNRVLTAADIVQLVNDWEEGDYKKATERIISAIETDASGNVILQPVLTEAKSAQGTIFRYWDRVKEPNPNKVPTILSDSAKAAEEAKKIKEQEIANKESDVKPNEKNFLLNVPIKIITSSDTNSINGIYISKPNVEKNVGINFVKENPIRVDKNSVNFLKKENIISLLPSGSKDEIVNAYNTQWENVSSELRYSGKLGYVYRGIKAPFVSTFSDIYKATTVNADILRYRNSAESKKQDNNDLNTRIIELELFVRKNGDNWYTIARSDSDKSQDFKYFKTWTELRNKVTVGPAKIVEKEAAEAAIDTIIQKINNDTKNGNNNNTNINKENLKSELEKLKEHMLPSDYANIVNNLTTSNTNKITITPEGYVKTTSGIWKKIPDFIAKIKKPVNILLGGKTRKHKKSKTQKAGRKNKKTMKH